METSAFLSGFCNYYSVLNCDNDDQLATNTEPEPYNGEWSNVEAMSLPPDYYENVSDPCLEVITMQELGEGSAFGNTTPVITTTTVESLDYLTVDQSSLDLGTVSTALELDYLNEMDCPFDWDLNLDNLLTTKTDLPELTPLCNDICNDFLEESSQLMSHASATNTQQPKVEEPKPFFQCTYDQCRKIYAKAAHLRSHLRRHLNEKPYVCTWINCQWKFNRSDELARHIRSHSGLKPYLCDYCSKKFSRSDHLSKHRKVHERKFRAGKAKGVWMELPKAKPGRKPKAQKQLLEGRDKL